MANNKIYKKKNRIFQNAVNAQNLLDSIDESIVSIIDSAISTLVNYKSKLQNDKNDSDLKNNVKTELEEIIDAIDDKILGLQTIRGSL